MRPAALFALALLVTSCSSAPASTAAPATSARATAAALPAYMTISLTDVRSGEKFALASLKGKVVIVEGMAVW